MHLKYPFSSHKMGKEIEAINVSKAATTTNMFYLFLHGGKAAVVPFLTLFFRLIGLSAFEAGCLIAAKTVTGLVWAPLWARCAMVYSRHRTVLSFSLFMMMATYLCFPALYTQLATPDHCPGGLLNGTGNDSSASWSNLNQNVTYETTQRLPEETFSTTLSIFDTTSVMSTIKPTTKATTSFTPSPAATSPTVSTTAPFTASDVVIQPTYPTIPTIGNTATPVFISTASVSTAQTTDEDQEIQELQEQFVQMENISLDSLALMSRKQLRNMIMDKLSDDLSNEEIETLVNALKSHSRQSKREASSNKIHKVVKRSWTDLDDLKEELRSIQSTLQTDRILLFLVILAIIVIGEIFSAPVEKVADDAWFEFLNRIDDLERYGQQRFWGSLAFVVIPIVVTLTVDHTPCFLPYHVHHYLLHFYIFVVLVAAALLLTCWFPTPPPSGGGKYSSKVCKSLKIIICNGRGSLFTITLLLTGAVYAAYHNFLFWKIQDVGGTETPMGLCVAIAAFAEIPMLLLSTSIVKKLGNSWVVSLSLLMLSIRTVAYAYIEFPYGFLPMELSHGITHTSLWFAILSFDDFNTGANLDRSLRSILSSFYFGFGFSAGSVLSGYVFDNYGSRILFLGCSILTGGWCLFFSFVQQCIPKKETVRYIKLLRSDSDISDEDEEDDWLERAMNDN